MYKTGETGICPYCNKHVQFTFVTITSAIGKEPTIQSQTETYSLSFSRCPACDKLLILLRNNALENDIGILIWPQSIGRPPVPPEVPPHITQDYNEAAAVLRISPKASAALSRRCLQSVLTEVGGAKKHDLAQQIDEVAPTLPFYISEHLHAVRNIGNFAAHPQKSKASGEILDVEPHEAEWNLEVLDELFQHYYVKPAQLQKRKDDFNKKLQEAGKPPLT